MIKLLSELTQFIWWTRNSAKQLPTLRPSQPNCKLLSPLHPPLPCSTQPKRRYSFCQNSKIRNKTLKCHDHWFHCIGDHKTHWPTTFCNVVSHSGAALTPLSTNAKNAFFTWQTHRHTPILHLSVGYVKVYFGPWQLQTIAIFSNSFTGQDCCFRTALIL